MLVELDFKDPNPQDPISEIIKVFQEINDKDGEVIKLAPGIYENNKFSFNFDHVIKLCTYAKVIDKWDSFCDIEKDIYKGNYGVCDNYEQILEKYPELNSKSRKFIIGLERLRKSEQVSYGWRWHKWGEYIGTQNPQCEYLMDEPEIEEIFCFHIYELE